MIKKMSSVTFAADYDYSTTSSGRPPYNVRRQNDDMLREDDSSKDESNVSTNDQLCLKMAWVA